MPPYTLALWTTAPVGIPAPSVVASSALPQRYLSSRRQPVPKLQALATCGWESENRADLLQTVALPVTHWCGPKAGRLPGGGTRSVARLAYQPRCLSSGHWATPLPGAMSCNALPAVKGWVPSELRVAGKSLSLTPNTRFWIAMSMRYKSSWLPVPKK